MVEHLKVGSKASRQEASLFCVANGFPVGTLSLCKLQLLVGWGMASTDVRGILTAFNPSLDFFAITTGDGRVKVRSFSSFFYAFPFPSSTELLLIHNFSA